MSGSLGRKVKAKAKTSLFRKEECKEVAIMWMSVAKDELKNYIVWRNIELNDVENFMVHSN